jgi:hypothetical protein
MMAPDRLRLQALVSGGWGGGKILAGDAWNADHSAERAVVHPIAIRETVSETILGGQKCIPESIREWSTNRSR